MMGQNFIIKYEDILNLEQAYKEQLEGLILNIDLLAMAIDDNIICNDKFTGATADAVKVYFDEVHLTLLGDIRVTAQSMLDNMVEYKTGYYDIDASTNFILDRGAMESFNYEM